jgi:hypothetical protein
LFTRAQRCANDLAIPMAMIVSPLRRLASTMIEPPASSLRRAQERG